MSFQVSTGSRLLAAARVRSVVQLRMTLQQHHQQRMGFASAAPWADASKGLPAPQGGQLPPGHAKRPYYHHHDWWKDSSNWTEDVKDQQQVLRRRRWIRVATWVLPTMMYFGWVAGRWDASVPTYGGDDLKGNNVPFGRLVDFPLIKWFMGSWVGQQFGNMSRRHPNSRWKLAASLVDNTELFWLEVARLRHNPEQRAAILREAYRLNIRMREMGRLEREALGLEPGKYLRRNLMLRKRRATHEQFMYERCLPFEQRIKYMTVEARLAGQRVAQRKAFIESFKAAGYPGSKGLDAPPSPIEAELRFGLPRVVV